MDLKDKVAIITGAGRGIGKAIAQEFAAQGANVVCAARTKKEIEGVANEIGGLAVECDVASEADARNLVDQSIKAYGQIDILVNNAGIGGVFALVEDLPVAVWDDVINVTLRGTFLCTKFALPSMVERKSGCIINISSGAGKAGFGLGSAYCAAKFAVNGFTESLAAENFARGIRVHVICPGATVSQMRKDYFPDEDPATQIQVEDVAEAAVYLATQKHTAYTRELVVNPGQVIKNL